MRCIKIGILGDLSVGKTSICYIFMNMDFTLASYDTFGEEKFEAKFTLEDGEEIKLTYYIIKRKNCKINQIFLLII